MIISGSLRLGERFEAGVIRRVLVLIIGRSSVDILNRWL